MITKERLKELIEQEATIWGLGRYWFQDKIEEIKLDRDLFCVEYSALLYPDLLYTKLEHLFETKKQAEWALKYHATRTEKLDLPMWEDFKSGKEIKFIDFYGHHYTFEMKNEDYIWLTFRTIFDDSEIIVKFDEPATEENYIKACDLCLKLFKGEENGN